MIEVENLTKYYGNLAAIENITFRVEKGEILGFLGPNGAGKTTTMRILAGFFPPTSGTARVVGYDVVNDSIEVRRRIGYMPETIPLYKDMRVKEYLDFVAEVKGIPRKTRKSKIEKVMKECGATEVSHRLIGKLSKGFQQRVGLAQALLHDPEVLILDEPTIGLDPKQIIEIRQLIKGLAGERTIILSTHILPEVSMTCQRVIIINEGKIIAMDTPENLNKQLQKLTQIFLQVEGPPEEVASQLGKVKGVVKVTKKEEVSPGVWNYIVESSKDLDVRKGLAQIILSHQWGLLELRPLGMSLEDIFVKLVTAEEREAE
ncbi:MFS transporter [bacterium (candidate division B38) B3_B38]|nr:MAG: MFS transporter [bacterium (candidate division B38) B3_B38]